MATSRPDERVIAWLFPVALVLHGLFYAKVWFAMLHALSLCSFLERSMLSLLAAVIATSVALHFRYERSESLVAWWTGTQRGVLTSLAAPWVPFPLDATATRFREISRTYLVSSLRVLMITRLLPRYLYEVAHLFSYLSRRPLSVLGVCTLAALALIVVLLTYFHSTATSWSRVNAKLLATRAFTFGYMLLAVSAGLVTWLATTRLFFGRPRILSLIPSAWVQRSVDSYLGVCANAACSPGGGDALIVVMLPILFALTFISFLSAAGFVDFYNGDAPISAHGFWGRQGFLDLYFLGLDLNGRENYFVTISYAAFVWLTFFVEPPWSLLSEVESDVLIAGSAFSRYALLLSLLALCVLPVLTYVNEIRASGLEKSSLFDVCSQVQAEPDAAQSPFYNRLRALRHRFVTRPSLQIAAAFFQIPFEIAAIIYHVVDKYKPVVLRKPASLAATAMAVVADDGSAVPVQRPTRVPRPLPPIPTGVPREYPRDPHECPICLNDVSQSVVMCTADHRLCLPDALADLRAQLRANATSDRGIYCPVCVPDGSAPLSPDALVLESAAAHLYEWSHLTAQAEALSPAEFVHFQHCLLAAAVAVPPRPALLPAPELSPFARAPSDGGVRGLRCPYVDCGADLAVDRTENAAWNRCAACKEWICTCCCSPWLLEAHGENTISHAGYTCAAFAEARRSRTAKDGVEAEFATNASVRGGKECPKCREVCFRGRGHACHHVNCAVCNFSYCYVCCGEYPCSNGCPFSCTVLCDCTPCPFCKVGQPCDVCPGGCPSCVGETPEERRVRELEQAQARADALKNNPLYVSPRASAHCYGYGSLTPEAIIALASEATTAAALCPPFRLQSNANDAFYRLDDAAFSSRADSTSTVSIVMNELRLALGTHGTSSVCILTDCVAVLLRITRAFPEAVLAELIADADRGETWNPRPANAESGWVSPRVSGKTTPLFAADALKLMLGPPLNVTSALCLCMGVHIANPALAEAAAELLCGVGDIADELSAAAAAIDRVRVFLLRKGGCVVLARLLLHYQRHSHFVKMIGDRLAAMGAEWNRATGYINVSMEEPESIESSQARAIDFGNETGLVRALIALANGEGGDAAAASTASKLLHWWCMSGMNQKTVTELAGELLATVPLVTDVSLQSALIVRTIFTDLLPCFVRAPEDDEKEEDGLETSDSESSDDEEDQQGRRGGNGDAGPTNDAPTAALPAILDPFATPKTAKFVFTKTMNARYAARRNAALQSLRVLCQKRGDGSTALGSVIRMCVTLLSDALSRPRTPVIGDSLALRITGYQKIISAVLVTNVVTVDSADNDVDDSTAASSNVFVDVEYDSWTGTPKTMAKLKIGGSELLQPLSLLYDHACFSILHVLKAVRIAAEETRLEGAMEAVELLRQSSLWRELIDLGSQLALWDPATFSFQSTHFPEPSAPAPAALAPSEPTPIALAAWRHASLGSVLILETIAFVAPSDGLVAWASADGGSVLSLLADAARWPVSRRTNAALAVLCRLADTDNRIFEIMGSGDGDGAISRGRCTPATADALLLALCSYSGMKMRHGPLLIHALSRRRAGEDRPPPLVQLLLQGRPPAQADKLLAALVFQLAHPEYDDDPWRERPAWVMAAVVDEPMGSQIGGQALRSQRRGFRHTISTRRFPMLSAAPMPEEDKSLSSSRLDALCELITGDAISGRIADRKGMSSAGGGTGSDVALQLPTESNLSDITFRAATALCSSALASDNAKVTKDTVGTVTKVLVAVGAYS